MPLSPLKKAPKEQPEPPGKDKPSGMIKESTGAIERSSVGAVELGKGFEEREAIFKRIQEGAARKKEKKAREQAAREAQRKKAEERKQAKQSAQENPAEGLFSKTGWAKKKKYGPQYLKKYAQTMGRDFKKKPEYMPYVEKKKFWTEHLKTLGGKKYFTRKELGSTIRQQQKELRKGSITPRQKKDIKARIEALKLAQLKKPA